MKIKIKIHSIIDYAKQLGCLYTTINSIIVLKEIKVTIFFF